MYDNELLKYFYDELIMTLITLSLPADEQQYMVGIGCIGDEILEDFDNFYRLRREFFIEKKLFNEEQLKLLDEFNVFLDKYNGHDQDFYWNIEELRNNPLWEELRHESKKVLTEVFHKKYKIELQRKHENSIDIQRESLLN